MDEVKTNASEFSVSEIAQAVKRTVEDSFGYVRVRGEISGFRGQHSSGHAYFTLKDQAAAIDAVVWKGNYAKLAFKPEEGLEVIATGRLTTFPRSSKYQIVIDNIEPAGAGALMALLEERRKKLLAEGLFARESKKPLPYLPRVIGVITSPTGAVIRDILHRLNDRFPCHVLVWPVRVQGETSAAEVVNAINGFNQFTNDGPIPRPDLLIVARGGGSIEDLWGFNEEAVVRATATSAIPIISAVGHETDTTLIDYASDMRAPTPTAAAEAAVPVRAELIGYVEDLGQRERHATRRIAASSRDRLRAVSAGLPRASDLISTQRQTLDHLSSNLLNALRHAKQTKTIQLERLKPRLAPASLSRRTHELRDRLNNISRRGDTGLRQKIDRARLRYGPVAQSLLPANQRLLERKNTALTSVSARLSPNRLTQDVRHAQNRLTSLSARLNPAFARPISERRQRLSGLDNLLKSLSYTSVLARGYALVRDAEGQLVNSVHGVVPGQELTVTFGDGDVGVIVSGAPATPKKKPRLTSGIQEQKSLF